MGRILLWAAASALVLSLAGCTSRPASASVHMPKPAGRVDGLTVYRVGENQPLQFSTTLAWSPTGSTFAFAVSWSKGTVVIGTTNPLRTREVPLGPGRMIVALTSHDAVVRSWSARQDWLYPLHGLKLGRPRRWHAATDTWQEWASTAEGPAVVTGGYAPGSAALTWANGKRLSLHGDQVYLSPDGRLGAVVTGRLRPFRNVHPIGMAKAPYEFQPSPTTTPIILWDFGGSAPHRLAVIHLPRLSFPAAPGPSYVALIQFSPNDRYVAVTAQAQNGSAEMIGQTFIFRTQSGRLVGIAPIGNGSRWAPDSQFLWLGTPSAEGSGQDRIVNVKGHTVWRWPDSMTNQVVFPLSGSTVLMDSSSIPPFYVRNALWVRNQKTGRRLLLPLGKDQGTGEVALAPNGTAALVGAWPSGPAFYVTWRR